MVQLMRHLFGSQYFKFGKDRIKIDGARDHWLHWLWVWCNITDTITHV